MNNPCGCRRAGGAFIGVGEGAQGADDRRGQLAEEFGGGGLEVEPLADDCDR